MESPRKFVFNEGGETCGFQCAYEVGGNPCGKLIPTARGFKIHLRRKHNVGMQETLFLRLDLQQKWNPTPAERTKLRKRLWSEREHVCYLCGNPILYFDDMELDHRTPEPAGCVKNWNDDNLELTHFKCNREKGSRRLP